MKLGIVGLPGVGKTTLFNSLTKGELTNKHASNAAKPTVGVVSVPDERVDWLAVLHDSQKKVYASIEFVDIAGLAQGASKGEGFGNKFLSFIREVDALIHVVRCYGGDCSPIEDIQTVNIELIFADLEVLERRIAKTEKTARNDKAAAFELSVLLKLKAALEEERTGAAVLAELDERERDFAETLTLLCVKPVIFAANVGEEAIADNPFAKEVAAFADGSGAKSFCVCAKLEEELCGLSDEEKVEFLAEMGVKESGLDVIIKESYALLGLISFLTAGRKEARAWTIRQGMKAPEAAGKIHTDLAKGFIRAETTAYADLKRLGTQQAAKEAGLVRLEGKEYIVKDGDVVLFRFNV